jgi:TPR repeat protein
MENLMKSITKWFSLATLIGFCNVQAADILKADRYFTEQQYELARSEYAKAAQLGNPHAYYQLARIHAQGLGVEQDIINALINYSLAAEYDYFDAQKVINDTLTKLSAEAQESFAKIMNDYKAIQGKQAIDAKYFPIINQNTLSKKITFNGEPSLKHIFHSDDFLTESVASLNNLAIEEGGNENAVYMSSPKAPYLILDIDISPDGSVRNYSIVQSIGKNTSEFIKQFLLFPQKKPFVNNHYTDFVHRVFIGAAGYSKSILVDKNEPMYSQILRTFKRIKQGRTLNERYQYTMAILNFPWLTNDPKGAEQQLLTLAQKGHPGAMFELGMLLYREQRDIQDAIYWISQSAKYGLIRAEYRLGMILISSPWVQHDEKKALFWFESAMEKGDINAAMRAINITLTAKDRSLINVESAVKNLNNIEQHHADNPEYYYLLALSYRDRKKRDFSKFVSNMRTAISRGNSVNWDTSEWQTLLNKSTIGTVYITDGK